MEMWPLRPNWRDPIRITHSFRTEVISSRKGREQRRALRQTARKTVEFSVTTSGDRFRTLVRAMHRKQGPILAWADQTRAVRSSAPSAGSSIPVQTRPEWAVPGQMVMMQVGDAQEIKTVQSANSAAITFTEPLANTWPSRTRVCPAVIGRLPPEAAGQQYLPGVIDIPISIFSDPGYDRERFTEAAEVWNGREVMLERGNWRDPREFTFTHGYETVDYGFGRVAAFQPNAFPGTLRSVDYVFKSKAEADRLLAFFERMKGQRGEFYAPTDQPDIILAATAQAFSQSFLGTGWELQVYNGDQVFAAISVKMTDGRRFYRKVISALPDGPHTRIRIEGTLPYALDPSTVEVISWLPVLRNASDDATFEWLTDEAGQVRFTYRSLPDAIPE